jgi:hypothetical protein
MTLSAKGPRHLDTIKGLVNYVIALTIHDPRKCGQVLEYLREGGELAEYLLFFDGVNDVRARGQGERGLEKLRKLPEESSD